MPLNTESVPLDTKKEMKIPFPKGWKTNTLIKYDLENYWQ